MHHGNLSTQNGRAADATNLAEIVRESLEKLKLMRSFQK